MGISHLAIAKATPTLAVVAVCDQSKLLGQVVERYCDVRYIPRYEDVISLPGLNGVVIATPTRFHEKMIRDALECNLHIFCEKPMTLAPEISNQLAEQAIRRGLVCQVGYHNRFNGTFREAKRLIDLGTIASVRHVHAEAYGPVVVKPALKTWRSEPAEGGGCLYDYAAHPLNLMNWYVGRPASCAGAMLKQQFSSDVEDAVYADLAFENGASGQISANWSDETMRKMTTRVTVWGDGGKMIVDRQELQVYIGNKGAVPPGYRRGWTVKYITELAAHPGYYLRGEEYSAQIEAFANEMIEGNGEYENSFSSGAETDFSLEIIRRAASEGIARSRSKSTNAKGDARPRLGMLARALGC